LKRNLSTLSEKVGIRETVPMKEHFVRRSAREKSTFKETSSKDHKKKKESYAEESYLGKRKRPTQSHSHRSTCKNEGL